MNKIYKQLFKESMVGVIGVITAVMLIGLLYLVPYLSQEQSKKDAYAESQRLVTYIKIFRAYYANNVLNKIKEHSDLKINFDHKIKEDTVPLPATLVHDLGALFTDGTSNSVQMYSNFPFPNRKERILDKFQQDALAFVLKNPKKIFTREDTIAGKKVFRTAIPDYLSANSCVNCHNFRPDTPKDTWRLGDVRGVIEVTIPLEDSLGSAKNLTYSIVAFILFNFSILALYYFLYMGRKNKKLQDSVTNKNKILSEYKRAVDLGAIVSKSDKSGIITYVNDSFAKVSGYSKKELVGRPHRVVKHPDTPKEVFREMWQKILNKEVWQGDLKNRAKDGSSYYVHATIVPIVDEHDEIVEFLAIRYETTSLHEAIEKANIAEKAKGSFLANMSHELRTPLNAIIGFSQILQRKNTLAEKEKTYIDKINLSGQNLLTLVNSILDFSKIEEGKMDFNPSQVNISYLFEEIMVLIESQAKEKELQITVTGFDKSSELFGDKQLLKQAFINILSNALKFTPQNGKIDVYYESKNSQHFFSICDNGVGISQDDLVGLFEPFKQGESAKKTAAKGTGLGLAITHKIITELHRGKLEVQSEIDKGTCFTISL